VDVASREVGTDLGLLVNRVDDLRDEMRAGFQDVRAEIRALRVRLDTLLLATIGGLLGVIATLAVKL
jgi:hypothetical protein